MTDKSKEVWLKIQKEHRAKLCKAKNSYIKPKNLAVEEKE